MKTILKEIKACTVCESFLPLGANPIVSGHPKSKIMIIGQAPGTRVHKTSVPWNDPSGDQLRNWLQVDKEDFYDETKFAIMPMGFCYPGKGKSGDLPPRQECAPLWHEKLWHEMKNIELTLLIGQYAQKHYLKNKVQRNLTETVRHYKDYSPQFIPLPHPSPRNRIWIKRNDWFEQTVLVDLRHRVHNILKIRK